MVPLTWTRTLVGALAVVLLTPSAAVTAASFLPSYAEGPAYDVDPSYWAAEEGVGHFSEWSKSTKRNFIDGVRGGNASEWVIVMGNEGGGE